MAKAKIYRLGWSGVELKEEEIQDLPDILKVDDWMFPTIGELCINSKNELDVVKDIKFRPSDGMFKACKMYYFENEKGGCSKTTRIEVKSGNTFIFNGKVFVHQEALSGEYIDKIARGEIINHK